MARSASAGSSPTTTTWVITVRCSPCASVTVRLPRLTYWYNTFAISQANQLGTTGWTPSCAHWLSSPSASVLFSSVKTHFEGKARVDRDVGGGRHCGRAGDDGGTGPSPPRNCRKISPELIAKTRPRRIRSRVAFSSATDAFVSRRSITGGDGRDVAAVDLRSDAGVALVASAGFPLLRRLLEFGVFDMVETSRLPFVSQ